MNKIKNIEKWERKRIINYNQNEEITISGSCNEGRKMRTAGNYNIISIGRRHISWMNNVIQ